MKTLVDAKMTSGFGTSVAWSGLDETGARVASGVYFCRLVTADGTMTRKLVLLA